MSSSVSLKIAADEYTYADLHGFNPIGHSWKLFDSGLSKLINELKERPSSKAYFLIGRYGMGKTLFIRKKVTELVRLEPHVAPIYAPLRRLADVLPALKTKEKNIEGFLRLLGKWFYDEGYCIVEEQNVWSLGKSLRTGSGINRLRVIYDSFITAKDLNDALKAVSESGLIPLLVLDELEALVVRGSRWNLGRKLGEPSAHGVIRDLFNSIYIIASGAASWRGLIVFTSVFDYEEWIRYPLREVALDREYSTDDPLTEFITSMGISSRSIERIRSIDDIEERLKAVDEEVKRVRQSNPLLQVATQERLRPFTLKLRYSAEEYEKFAEMLGIELAIKGLPHLFEKIELKPRTLIFIVMRLKELGFDKLTYETLGNVIRTINKFNDFRNVINRLWRRTVHAKWPQRLLGLAEEGLILFDYDIVLPDPSQRDELLERLSRALDIEIQRPLTMDGLSRIRNVLDNLRLNYEIVRQDYLRNKNGRHRRVYYIDENVVRWIFGDTRDEYGEEIDIERYLERNIASKRRERLSKYVLPKK